MLMRLLLIFTLSFFALFTHAVHAEPLPAQVHLNFVGPFQVPASMTFTHNNREYRLETTVNIPFKKMEFTSIGSVDGKRLITHSFTDIRGGKNYAGARFDLTHKKIHYGRGEQNLSAEMTTLAQDFFTTAWQATLNHAPLNEKIQTTNGKKVYQRPPFVKVGEKEGYINGKRTPIILYASGEGDDRVELGLAPKELFLPALIAYYEKGKRYELVLKSYSTK